MKFKALHSTVYERTYPKFSKTNSFIRTANKVAVYVKQKYGMNLTITEIENIISCQFKVKEAMADNRTIVFPFLGRFIIKKGRKVYLQNMTEINRFAEEEGISINLAIRRFIKERADNVVTFERKESSTPLKTIKFTNGTI